MRNLRPALEHLYAVLEAQKVPAVSALQPGLHANAINSLVSRLPYATPAELAELYRWRNGAITTSNGELFPGGTFLALTDAMAAYQRLVGAAREATRDTAVKPIDVYDPHWFPIFLDGAGNPHVVLLGTDPTAGSIWYIPIEDAAHRQVAAQNLKDFIEVVSKRWEAGAYYLDKATGIPMENLAKLAAERRSKEQPQVNVSALVNDLASTDARARGRSLRLLKEFLFPEAVEPLVGLLTDPDPTVRADAASLLGQIGDPKAVTALREASRDQDDRVRTTVEWALQHIKP